MGLLSPGQARSVDSVYHLFFHRQCGVRHFTFRKHSLSEFNHTRGFCGVIGLAEMSGQS